MLKRFAITVCLVFAIVVVGTVTTPETRAQGLSFIRDSEIEGTIRSYTTPLFGAAGLDANAVSVFIVNDKRLNAFVAGGMNLFVNTGMLIASAEPGEIIGVLAHETGHIAGGHLARTREAIRNASAETILAYILGAGAIIAGQSQAGGAILQGGSGLAQNSLIQYSQAQEQSADQAAVRLLDTTGQSSLGLLRIFGKLEDQELLSAARQDPYLRSHPLTRQRISFVQHHYDTSAYSKVPPPDAQMMAHQRMVAKLVAFLDAPSRTFKRYPESDTSFPARYARAIALYRIPETSRALSEIRGLLSDYPKDPWLHELEGQILFESGRVQEAVKPYERAVALAPDAPLLRLELSRALLESSENLYAKEAVEHLKRATRAEPTYSLHWKMLGIAYGRDGDIAQSSLAFAEAAMLRGEFGEAIHHADRAAAGLKIGAPARLRAEDIKHAAQIERDRKK